MKTKLYKAVVVSAGALILLPTAWAEPKALQGKGKHLEFGNELIDITAFEKSAREAIISRENRRVTESRFLEMAREKDTIILDTRSAAKFALLHVKGAQNLNFSDLTKESLEKSIPSKKTRILIYCNNNFDKEPKAFPSKAPSMALNIPTFITLHAYGYENVYELGPLLDIKKTRIPLEGVKFASNR